MDERDEKKETRPSAADAELEREIRSRRKFTMAEAIGRLGGNELLKGASPVTAKRQAELQIEHHLERNLTDADGALEAVLLRHVKESEVLLGTRYEEPLAAMAHFVEQLLSSEELLGQFVREVDAQWGRMYDERPYFQKDGQPPHRDDPYTLSSVRAKLTRLIEQPRNE